MKNTALAVSTAILLFVGAVTASTAQDRAEDRPRSPTANQVQDQEHQSGRRHRDDTLHQGPNRNDDHTEGTMQQQLDGGDGD
jgi:hypothetical protein